MRTKLSKENPFGVGAKGYLWERKVNDSEALELHLDYGAHDGKMLQILSNDGLLLKGIGVDLNSKVVEAAQNQMPMNVELLHIKKNELLPFPDSYFTSVTMIGVLEHIYDQDSILKELVRVTKPGGELLFAVPGKHFFSFLDMGNWKFVFPNVHRFLYVMIKSKRQYTDRYLENPDGLVGDIEKEKSWHQHFTKLELVALLERHGLIFRDQDGLGFFHRILINLRFCLPKPIKKLLDPLIDIDARCFSAAEIWVLVEKRA